MVEHPARQLVDNTWLQGSNGLLVVTRTRVERDRGYAQAFRLALGDLLEELWPFEEEVEFTPRLEEIAEDVDRMPIDLLDDLVDALNGQAKALGSPDTPANAALRLLAGWLRTRAVEMRGDDEIKQRAAELKPDYPELFAQAFAPEGVVAGATVADVENRYQLS